MYDIIGPAANLAARLEALCEPMEICLTSEMAAELRTHFRSEPKATVDVKGFGELRVSRLLSALGDPSPIV